MSATSQDHPNLQDLHLAQKAFAKGNNELSFKLLNKIKSTKVPTQGTDLLRKDFPEIKADKPAIKHSWKISDFS